MVSEKTTEDYRGIAAIWLDAQDIKIWSKVVVKTKKGTFKGIVIPRGEQGDDKHIVIKLLKGWNLIFITSIIIFKRTFSNNKCLNNNSNKCIFVMLQNRL